MSSMQLAMDPPRDKDGSGLHPTRAGRRQRCRRRRQAISALPAAAAWGCAVAAKSALQLCPAAVSSSSSIVRNAFYAVRLLLPTRSLVYTG